VMETITVGCVDGKIMYHVDSAGGMRGWVGYWKAVVTRRLYPDGRGSVTKLHGVTSRRKVSLLTDARNS
jgi:hypothetical protein